MKKTLLLLVSLCYLTTIQSQVVYSDNFDQSINNTGYPTGYTTSIVSNNLRITGNGSAGAYAALSYDTHANGTLTNVNVSGTNKLFIKAKGTNSPNLRVDLQDAGGYSTNQNASTISLTNTYTIYEINYTGKLLDGGYGGPCTPASAPCTVNPNTINTLLLFVNSATGNYNGTIDID